MFESKFFFFFLSVELENTVYAPCGRHAGLNAPRVGLDPSSLFCPWEGQRAWRETTH